MMDADELISVRDAIIARIRAWEALEDGAPTDEQMFAALEVLS